MDELYSILGVNNDASQAQIKKAHRKLIVKHHPDKNGGEASQEFLDIQKAYEILSNLKTRETYDLYGFTEADNKYKMLAGVAETLIQHCISQGIAPDLLINEAEKQLRASLSQLKDLRKKVEQGIDKLRAQKDALKLKKGAKLDLIGDIILRMIGGKEAERLKNISDIELHESLLDLLSKYEKGVPPVHVNNFSTFNVRTPPIWGTGL
jgi:curved DNA-binding protein CbpA